MVNIIDGNQLACRCYFSLEPLTTSKGKRTETIYSVLISIRKLIREYGGKNTTFFLTWDGGNNRRKAIFPDYKGGRKRFEDAFYEQLAELRKILSWCGIKQYHFPTIEADDLIGTLTIKSRKKGQKVFIISSDHDFEQLISRHVEVLHPLANNLIKNVQYVIDKYGITPDRIVEAMAITGDPTDNIPGIEGVGDKTAAKLIIANGSLDEILKNPDNLKMLNRKGCVVDAKDDLKQKIKLNLENIKIAYKLVKIIDDLDVEPDFTKQQIDFEAVKQEFKDLEFEQFLNEFDRWETTFRSQQS
ncbi:MAG: 5'-3' exonuclease H3TH domain-containing protein [Candidatus Nanoarchaeia archaeon]|jgi:DNA polymerase-1|nr:5'-3' exonuclease H3TH domain-containing protein [Candidatus Nanoarchaeia archaeon]